MGATTLKSDRAAYIYIGVFSAVLYSVLLIAPVVAAMLAKDFNLPPSRVGLVFSLELACFSLATIPAYLWLKRVDARVMTIACGVIVVAGNLLSAWTTSFAALLVIRAITSLAAGSITVLILSLSGKTNNPSRAYGLFVVAQLAMGAVILLGFPLVYSGKPASSVYLTIAILVALAIPAAWCLDGSEFRKPEVATTSTTVTQKSGKNIFLLGSALVAVFGFYFALGGVWTFMAELGEAAGISLDTASSTLGLATVAGVAAALAATLVGESKKSNLYITLGYLMMGGSMFLLLGVPALAQFAIAAVMFKIAWSWLLPFLLAAVSRIGGPQTMNSTNLMIGSGLGLSPVFAGRLIEATGGYQLVVTISLAILAVAFIASAVVMRNESSKKQILIVEEVAEEEPALVQ